MVLHEFHVAQRHTVAIGQRHAIPGDDAAIGIFAKHARRTAGGDDHRPGFNEGEFTGGDANRHRALCAAVIDDQVDTKMFIETLDRWILE